MKICPASQIKTRSLEFLWPHRFPDGKPTMLDGDAGLGKTLIGLDLCARLSTGREFPDGSPSPGPVHCLVLSGDEDDEDDTIVPRLKMLGADLDRVHVYCQEEDDDALLRLPSQTSWLADYLSKVPVRFMLIDPILAFLDAGVVISSETSVRAALRPLRRLGKKYRCVPQMNRHLNKRAGSRALYRGTGSLGFNNLCRSAWIVGRDPQAEGRFVFAQQKVNYAAPQPSLGYAIDKTDGSLPVLRWLGPVPWTADQILVGKPPGSDAVVLEHAKSFLVKLLRDQPLTTDEIWKLAEKEGISDRTLRRARHDLGILFVRIWIDRRPVTYWHFKDQDLPDHIPRDLVPPSLEEWLGPLREKYPPATPLDA